MFNLGGVRRRGLRRFVDGGTREVNRPMRMIAVSTAALLVVTLAPAQAIAGRGDPARSEIDLPELQQETPVSGADSTASFQMPVAPGTQIEYAPTRITPIDGATDQIILGSTGGTQAFSTATAEEPASAMQQVASLPLWVGPAQSQTPAQTEGFVAQAATTEASGSWTVTVSTRAETEAAGIDGVLMTLEPSPDATPVDLTLKYWQFEQLYGAGWASRLQFVQFPECFLTTPEVAGCSEATEVASVNNANTDEVTATVAAPEPAAGVQAFEATSASSAGGAVVLAATGAGAGGEGDYKATSLQASGKWSAGGSSGGFSWEYPITVPPVAAGPTPSVSLGYSSQSVDGRTSTTNNQASWVGDGWDYHPGFIERTYRTCADDKVGSNTTKKTGDLCWGSENAVMSLNGTTVQLVKDNTTGVWKPQADNGTRVEPKFGAVNGDDNGEYWLVTAPDGTKYHFGLNRLPGWAAGNPTTDSVFTVPVFGNQTGEPCYDATYENSACTQAWRWNLDYVEDTHGNAMSLYWKQEKNWYAQAGKTDQPKPYVRGGWLDRIEYGLRADSVYSRPAPAKVTFIVEERCLLKPDFDCSDAKFTKHSTDGLHWPDVPVDSLCKDTGKCYIPGPTFWIRKWLATVKTEVATASGANTYRPVDSFELKHNFLDAQYDTNPPAWLDSIRRTGHASDGTISSLPPVTFHANAVSMPNRQTGPGDNRPPFVRLRVAKIFTETGGGITVNYSAPDPVCTPGAAKPKPEENTSRCFPVFWAPDGEDDPTKLEWFNKYVVVGVSEEDFVGGSPAQLTSYEYLDGAAWAKDDSEFSKPSERTWSDWRGYARVRTATGQTDTSAGTVAGLTETRYFRGMDGDLLPTGPPRNVTVTDSTGAVIAEDLPPYQGAVAETITYLANTTTPTVNSRSVTVPWHRKTATQTRAGLPDLEAFQLATASSRSIEAISGGRTRTVEDSTLEHDAYGFPLRQENRGDTAVTGDERCTVTTYAHNTTANLLGAPTQTRTTAGLCADAAGAGPSAIVADIQTYYDNQAFGVAPTKGDVTASDAINGSGTGYTRISSTSYDPYGRPTLLTDADGKETTTAYTPADNGTPTQTVETNPLGHQSTTQFETGRGQPATTTDANGRVTRTAYDPLGRVTEAWSPSRQTPGTSPNIRIAYEVSAERPTVVTTQNLRDDGTYAVGKTLYDGLLRVRQTQSEAVGPGRLVTDTYYNANGTTRRTNHAYLASGDPADHIYIPTSTTQIRTWTEAAYDGLDRPIKAELWYGGASSADRAIEVQYAGDYTITIPPTGGTATRTWTDAHGRTVKLDQFTNATRTEFTSATYTHDARGNRTSATDPAGNNWTWTYDARGQVTSSGDPDKGQTTFTYDNVGRVTTETDARANTLANTYDPLGRKTTLRTGDANGPKLAEWTYDAPGALGLAAKSIRYDNGNAYTTEITGYDTEYRPLATSVTIPSNEGALAGTYTTTTNYTPTGNVADTTLPAVGNLPAEKLISRYTPDGQALSLSGLDWYTADTVYSPYGEVLRTQTGAAPKRLWTTNTYNEHTGEQLTSTIHRETGPHLVTQTGYGYDKSGNVTNVKNATLSPGGTPVNDLQCFTFDALRRMTQAWTSTNTTQCATTPSTGANGTVGGPDAYWTSYTYDAIGNRLTETLHDPAGNTAQDTARAYAYPTAPTGNTHQLASVSSTGPAGPHVNTYTYDATGNTTTRTGPSGTQTLTWDAEDKLQTLTTTGTDEVVRYLYDASGTLLLRRNQGNTTLFLGTDELVLNTATGTVSATRYYDTGSGLTAVRTNDGTVSYLAADHHGTNNVNIDADTQAITYRQTKPFGEPRGTAPTAWPGQQGFVGGTIDINTSLTNLGARQYDPQLGRFLSADPLQDLADPQQWNAYGYGNNNPTTISDPSGLFGGFSLPGMPKVGNPLKGAFNVAKSTFRNAAGGFMAGVAQTSRTFESMSRFVCALRKQCSFRQPAPAPFTPRPALPSVAIDHVAQDIAQNPNSRIFRVARFVGEVVSTPGGPGGSVGKAGTKIVTKTVTKTVPKAAAKTTVKGTVKATSERVATKCNSFPSQTPVVMGDGTTKAIKDVEHGERVAATDPLTGETAVEIVTDVIKTSGDRHYTKITVQAADGTRATLTSTQHHPYWNAANDLWVNATDLKPGDLLQQPDGTTVTVIATSDYTSDGDTYNLTVSRIHTYFVVVGESVVLVHNCGPMGVAGLKSYFRLNDAVERASQRPPATVRASLTPGELQTGIEKPYLQRMFLGTNIEKSAAESPAVLGDPNILHLGASQRGQSVPDFKIVTPQGEINIDVTGPSVTSINEHLRRDYIDSRWQIITYDAPDGAYLGAIFQ